MFGPLSTGRTSLEIPIASKARGRATGTLKIPHCVCLIGNYSD